MLAFCTAVWFLTLVHSVVSDIGVVVCTLCIIKWFLGVDDVALCGFLEVGTVAFV